ncbi:PEPTIDASE S8 [Salix purpurea]|uniref:PEPTIDASE S8 n=1 Tax=Salix purpurea TaxID=77065 RepID=A0A9Q0Q5X7_SALPP|nr:PEPTIDASE S8 [Salix purpurea]
MTPMVDGRDGLEATPFKYGAGHIRPNRAQDPGLVFDLSINDYLDFLCASGYKSTMIEPFSDGPYKCPESTSIVDFNNPSITIRQLRNSMSVIRKVKNVGLPGTYAAHVREPYGISVSVEPNILTFEKEGDEKSFKVSFEARWDGVTEDYEFGSLTWTDGRHYVRSPIVVAFGGDYQR